ncbi:nascent polypeptide-associated complex subunit alpha, muscle-specific form isoform X3 [Anopheles stephensi]|uniref:nascent polypeptide-associated complex subunit alpha, muscle-specific form isoform X3 n=1 Tax=Anopheles stephensi TaxID=30069 RepID=UPI001658BD7B|nr:nascent polypeptide-associated complex subunit alpha, muscle-specific form isoform X3 [Anopheles stephensi]
MIGSFWNLCRACPSMPVDKLHSEYRSTYRWHEYTGGPDVVRKPPVPNQFAASSKADHFFSKSTEDEKFIEASINEPPLPRRKKCPELAYRTNEFLAARGKNETIGHDRTDAGATTHTRARSEERGTPSRRSKSEGPPAGVANGRLPTGTGYANGTIEPVSHSGRALEQAGESSSSGLFKKTITKLSTEYRLQFVWPHVRRAIRGGPGAGAHGAGGDGDGADTIDAPPRKSLSMGALKAAQIGAAGGGTIASVHKKRTTNEREATATELEPLVNDCETSMEKSQQPNEKRGEMARVVEQKLKALRVEKEKFGFEPEAGDGSRAQASSGIDNAWYKEVLELRKKAGEYRNRGWGVEMNPDLFNKQVELWDQVSRRSSLSALSLASSVRPITKEEKEKENNKKSSPTKPFARGARVPGSARPVELSKAALPDGLNFSAAARSRKDAIRHHLERTTGPDVEEGALLPSPTREKLMPAIPRSKADSPQRGSPQKTALSRHGSPQKGSPQKISPKKMSGRSQSVGPTVAPDGTTPVVAGGSPKRQIRSGSTVAASTASSAAKTHKKTPTSATAPTIAQNQQPQQPERRPRPTSLSTTTNHSRSKSSTLPASRLHPPHTSNLTNLTNNNHLPNASPSSSATTMAASIIAPTNNSTPAVASTGAAAARAKLTLATGGTKRATPQSAGRTAKPPTSLASDSSAPSSASSTLRKKQRGVGEGGVGSTGGRGSASARSVDSDKKLPIGSVEDADKESAPTVSPAVAVGQPTVAPPPEILEQIIKSPPEPTRVKSPEQIIMRSPDPVNWTVPLDTGKTFTVTQNVREGDPMIRPHSEIKASTPVEQPPPPPQSAPPELSEQSKMPNTKLEPSSIKESEDEDDDLPRSKSSVASSVNPTSIAISEPMTVSHPPPSQPSAAPTVASSATGDPKDEAAVSTVAPPVPAPEPVRYDKPVAGSTLRCLDDPTFESDINSPLGNRNVATEVLDKARDRFDRFWGNPNEKPEES